MSDHQSSPLGLPVPDELLDRLAIRVADLLADRLEANGDAPDPWLDVEAAARYLACEPHRVYDLAASGRLRCAKDGRRSLFRREWLDQALEQTADEPRQG